MVGWSDVLDALTIVLLLAVFLALVMYIVRTERLLQRIARLETAIDSEMNPERISPRPTRQEPLH